MGIKDDASAIARLIEAAEETSPEVYAAMRSNPRAVPLADAAEPFQECASAARKRVTDRTISDDSIK
ncbi:hypothetical protein [Streptomyces natalensis]|uniref:Uncharacterized protein n=1 Tax=Streptomyces natalensis ATCC 27448 TaxID=1240678 RepID=A0A0D7CFH7_9ACTN|nr:hypothetical protein [Streptomyces natalensis]KIZ14938.1 hypothetical protein SNA_29960 [Streptomyces natalensis ATCC 27448]